MQWTLSLQVGVACIRVAAYTSITVSNVGCKALLVRRVVLLTYHITGHADSSRMRAIVCQLKRTIDGKPKTLTMLSANHETVTGSASN